MQQPASKPNSNSRRPRSSNKPHSAGHAPHVSKAADILSNSRTNLACAGNTCTSFRADFDSLTILNFPFT
jgi:hypothetical protein